MTTKKPFIDPRILKDRTFVLCTLLSTGFGVIFNGSMVLTPQLLQTELHYPVVTAGLIMGPRGFGTLFAMFLFGRVANKLDLRILVAVGLGTIGYSMYLMSGWSLNVGTSPLIWVGILQGFGIGMSFAPMTTLAFATLPGELRTEASGFSNLLRNTGGAVGISIVVSQLTEMTARNHERLGEYITPFRQGQAMHGMSTTMGLILRNFDITLQAGMIGYINIFRMLAWLSFAFLPLLLFIRAPKMVKQSPEESASAMAH